MMSCRNLALSMPSVLSQSGSLLRLAERLEHRERPTFERLSGHEKPRDDHPLRASCCIPAIGEKRNSEESAEVLDGQHSRNKRIGDWHRLVGNEVLFGYSETHAQYFPQLGRTARPRRGCPIIYDEISINYSAYGLPYLVEKTQLCRASLAEEHVGSRESSELNQQSPSSIVTRHHMVGRPDGGRP